MVLLQEFYTLPPEAKLEYHKPAPSAEAFGGRRQNLLKHRNTPYKTG
jgi:hypothetical protein